MSIGYIISILQSKYPYISYEIKSGAEWVCVEFKYGGTPFRNYCHIEKPPKSHSIFLEVISENILKDLIFNDISVFLKEKGIDVDLINKTKRQEEEAENEKLSKQHEDSFKKITHSI